LPEEIRARRPGLCEIVWVNAHMLDQTIVSRFSFSFVCLFEINRIRNRFGFRFALVTRRRCLSHKYIARVVVDDAVFVVFVATHDNKRSEIVSNSLRRGRYSTTTKTTADVSLCS
jgi:hypothetical protein